MRPSIVDSDILSESCDSPYRISLTAMLDGEGPDGDWWFVVVLDGQIVLEGKWQNGLLLENEYISTDFSDPITAAKLADKPLVLLLRILTAKAAKDTDPLINPDNRAGGNVDLLPLILGLKRLQARVKLVDILTGEEKNCDVHVNINSNADNISYTPLLLTMLNANCLPITKEGTVYLCALGVNGLSEPVGVHFGIALSTSDTRRITWASISAIGYAALSNYSIPNEDKYIPNDFDLNTDESCIVVYWNVCKRVLISNDILQDRLVKPFFIEIAGVPKAGKIDVRGRYMGFVEAGVLLEPGEQSVTTCAKLLYFSETELSDYATPLLDLPVASGKIVVRDTNILMDDAGHTAYVTIKFDLLEPLVSKMKTSMLYNMIDILRPEGVTVITDELDLKESPEDKTIDVRKIKKECGALFVHSELSSLACSDSIVMNQSIKRLAANRLLMRIKAMLKQFPPGKCANIDFQDIVTSQHSAARRAVNASFAPQAPPILPPFYLSAARSRLAGDMQTANVSTETSINIAPNHPKSWLVKALRSLEKRNDIEAREFLVQGVTIHPNNKYLLWALGAQESEIPERRVRANALFLLSIKRNLDSISNIIGWSAIHTIQHYSHNTYSAFIAAKKMRKWYELFKDWRSFLDKWKRISGEEEFLWDPTLVDVNNPFIITSAFFLCLRAYRFSEMLLNCYSNGCATRGARFNIIDKIGPDVFYIRAASLLLRHMTDKALEQTWKGIDHCGPSTMMLQMRATCLLYAGGWDGKCETALKESERAAAKPCPMLLLRAALGAIETNPKIALQRAARAHKIAPCAQSALVISRIYFKLNEDDLSERWAAAAVKLEPNFSDGWAFLASLAIRAKKIDKARSLMRTAYQVGHVSKDIEEILEDFMDIYPVESLPQSIMKDICFCDFL